MMTRVQDRDGAYARWAIGTPYANTQVETVRMRFWPVRGAAGTRPVAPHTGLHPTSPLRRALLPAAGLAMAGGVLGLLVGSTLSVAPLLLVLLGLVCGAISGLSLAGNT